MMMLTRLSQSGPKTMMMSMICIMPGTGVHAVSKGNGPLNQSTGLLSVPMDREREGTGLIFSSSSFLL